MIRIEPFNLGALRDGARDPAHPALIDAPGFGPARTFSHGELDAASDAVARALRSRGLAPRDRIAILAANRMEYLALHNGAMKAGLVSVPVNHRLPAAQVQYVLDDCGARLVFADRERLALVPAGRPCLPIDDGGFEDFVDRGPFEPVRPAPDAPAMILYTSGSTGRPKGVVLSHRSHLWVSATIGATVAPHHRMLVAAPMYHMNALMMCAIGPWAHITLVLLPAFDAAAYLQAIEAHRCTWLSGVPTMMALVVRERERLAATDRSSVEMISMASAPLTQNLYDEVQAAFPQAVVRNFFGTTEAGPVVFGPHPDGRPMPDLSTGCASPHVELRLVGPDGRAGDEGVLQIRCTGLMNGYLNLPDATSRALTPDGFYVTGDVFRRDADGFHFFVGRADDMFVCGGENIYPAEVEKLLERHPDVQQACVVPRADAVKGHKPVAVVVPRAGAPRDEAAVRRFALEQGPAYQHPRRVLFVDALPLAGTNKVDRRAVGRLVDEALGASA
jgi:acyl-CoA synthetase (AMP-forming)/AMP-acid ligase II